MVLPNRQPPHQLPAVARPGPVLGCLAALAGVAEAAGGDGAGNHALALGKARHGRSQLLDDAYGLMADGQAAGHRIFALEDVHVGAADGRGGDAEQRIEEADVRNRLVVEDDAPRLDENGGFHPAHIASLRRALQPARRVANLAPDTLTEGKRPLGHLRVNGRR